MTICLWRARGLFTLQLFIFFFSLNVPRTSIAAPIYNSESSSETIEAENLANLTRQAMAPNEALEIRVRASENRQALLRKTLEIKPETAYYFFLSARTRAKLPAAVQQNIESEATDITGKFWIFEGIRRDGTSFTQYRLEGDDRKYHPLYVLSEDRLPASGARVAIKNGYVVADAFLAENNSWEVLEPPIDFRSETTASPQYDTLLALGVKFLDVVTQYPFTVAQIDTGMKDTNSFFLENSYNQQGIWADSRGIYQVAFRSTDACNTILDGIADAAKGAAVASGLDVTRYKRFFFIFPYTPNCNFVGLSQVNGNISWGNAAFDRTVVAHELGHQFGLSHSHSLKCAATGPLDQPCTTSEYGDRADTMGLTYGHFNAAQKERLGWFNKAGAPQLQTVTQNGRYRLENYEPVSTNVKAIKVLYAGRTRSTPESSIYVECRGSIGYDKEIGYFGDMTSGPLLHWYSRDSYLLNMRPADTTWRAPILSPQASFDGSAAPNGGFTITTLSRDANGCDIRVDSIASCARANPIPIIYQRAPIPTLPGHPTRFALFLMSNDSRGCQPQRFSMSIPPVSGISFSGPQTVTVAPQMVEVIPFSFQADATIGSETYPFAINTTNIDFPQFATRVPSSIKVSGECKKSGVVVTVAPPSQSAPLGATLTYKVIVASLSAGCPDASFSLALKTPTGFNGTISPTVLTLAPGAVGYATLNITATTATPGSARFSISATMQDPWLLSGGDEGEFVVTPPPPPPPPCVRVNPRVSINPGGVPQIVEIRVTANIGLRSFG